MKRSFGLLAVLCLLTTGLAHAQTTSNGWTKQFNTPELTYGGQAARPQGILTLGSDEILTTAHFNNTISRAYKIQISTGTTLASFSFPSPYVHIASVAQRGDGTYWFADYATGYLLEVDLAASFTSGTAVILEERPVMGANLLSGLAWVTVWGDEYLLLAEYKTTGTPYLYALHNESMKRLEITQRLQGIVFHNGLLYVASNRLTGESPGSGKVQTVDFVNFLGTGYRSDTWLNYVTSTFLAPSNYPEDLTITYDGKLWTLTEGNTSTGTSGWLAAWSITP